MPSGATRVSAAARLSPPTDSRMSSNGSPSAGRAPTTTSDAPSSRRPSARSGRPTTAVTNAPFWAASCTANRPTPPAAPVTATRLPSTTHISTAFLAVRPATGRVAAASKVTSSGSSASICVDTAARSAHAPDATRPTTGAPSLGPRPSGAAEATTPETSHPGRQPASASCRACTSPRLRDTAFTSMTAS